MNKFGKFGNFLDIIVDVFIMALIILGIAGAVVLVFLLSLALSAQQGGSL